MEMRFNTTPAWSDNGKYSYASSIEEILSQTKEADIVRLHGDDIVSIVYGQPLEKVVGTWLFKEERWFVANYLYSTITSREGRAEAYHRIEAMKRPFGLSKEPVQLESATQLSNVVAFDIETGGKSKIRCVSFYDGRTPFYIDCRDIKSNKDKRALLTEVFSSNIKWIAHYGYHDMKELCKVLHIPEFPIHIDTIWFHRRVEFRSLRYLSAVYLGATCYKYELTEANIEQNFDKLVKYCCKDSFYTYHLAKKFEYLGLLRSSRLLNQVLHTMTNVPILKLEHSIFELYPQLEGMGKAELKKQLTYISPKHIQLFLRSVNPPKPTISYHSLDGLSVRVPEELTTDTPLWMIAMEGNTVQDIMAHDVRFDSIALSVYRHNNNIEPTRHFGDYDVDVADVFLVNDVCCLLTKEYPNSIPVTFNEVKGLFNA